MKAWVWTGLAVLSIAAVATGCAATRAGYATAPHVVVRRDGAFEIRDYPALQLAQTSMDRGENGGFMRLFDFISGKNEAGEKIAMTTPVFMERAPGGETGSMAFVLPEGKSRPPSPSRTNVWIREVAAGRFAAHRFPAPRPDAVRETAATGALREWLAKEGLQAVGDPVFAYFDPPWIPRWFRRNEVMLRLRESAGTAR